MAPALAESVVGVGIASLYPAEILLLQPSLLSWRGPGPEKGAAAPAVVPER